MGKFVSIFYVQKVNQFCGFLHTVLDLPFLLNVCNDISCVWHVLNHAHTAKCQFHTRGINMSPASNELHQIVYTFSVIRLIFHPPFTLVLTFPVFARKSLIEKLRVSIIFEPLTLTSTPVIAATTATFLYMKKCNFSVLKKIFLNLLLSHTIMLLSYPFQTLNRMLRYNSPFSH